MLASEASSCYVAGASFLETPTMRTSSIATILSLAAFVLPATLLGCSGSSSSNPDDGGTSTGPTGSTGTSSDGGGSTGPTGSTGSDAGWGSGGKDSGTPTGHDGGGNPGTDSGTPSGNDGGGGGNDGGGNQQSHIKTVFVILMENHNWSDIKGASNAPYINSLLALGASTSNYFDNPTGVHPSEPNYIWIESGSNLGFTTDDDPSGNHDQTTTDHFVSQLDKAGVSWKSYQEDLPANQCGTSSTGLYAAKHNPMVFFTDISGSPPSNSNASCIKHVRPYTDLANDLASNTVAQYNFITPNLCNDMHNTIGCASLDAIANGDNWLKANVPAILASSAYKNGGALFITWDESENGEFPIGMIVLSPFAKTNYVGATKYYHSSLLRTEETIFGVSFLRDAANQADLSDLFTSFP